MKHLLSALALAISSAQAVTIDAVYFGQTHVLKPSNPYFGLVGSREALIKAHVTDPAAPASPAVSATLSLGGQTLIVPLTGPATLPVSIPDGLGVVQHSYANSFTAILPAAWVKTGLQVTVNAGTATSTVTDMKVGAPTKVIMTMFDVQYFADTTGNYPTNTFTELEAKWPVADLEVRRLGHVVFPELVIPPRADVNSKAVRIKSKAEYQVQTGLTFDGEQSAALAWNGALKRAAGRSGRWSLYYLNVYNAFAGGQAGGFAGVGSGTSVGILHHELGHALSLPHWGDSAAYPYKGDMHGIQAPANYNETHAGPAWAFHLPTRAFIPPTVQAGNPGGKPVGTYKVDPMQGGGTGWQESPYLMNHFSDYSVNQMRSYLQGHVVIWNSALNSYAQWNQTTGDYTTTVSNNGVQFPATRDTQVISILASVSGSNPGINMVYPPIGPYTSGLIRLFDPSVAADRTAAQSLFSPTNGSDYCVRVVQGGVTKTYMLAASNLSTADPFAESSLITEAVNLPSANGTVTKIELLSTPNAEDVGLPANPTVLYTWAPLMPEPGTFELPPTANSSSAITMTALPGEVAFGSTGGTIEYRFTETSGNPGATTSAWQTSRSYTDTGLQAGTAYSYTVSIRAGTLATPASAPASATTTAASTVGSITVNDTQQFTLPSGNGYKTVTGLGTFTATGADKLVVVVAAENANNDHFAILGVRYNGVQMIEAVQQTGITADGAVGIYYLDNPGAVGSGISISGYNPNGGLGAAYALSGTRPGFGAFNSRKGSTVNSVPLTTSADKSLVIAALNNAGNGNSAGTPTANSPLVQASSGFWGSQWGSHASGSLLVATPSTVTPTFTTTTGSSYNLNIAAVEFLAEALPANTWVQTAGNAQNWTTAANWADTVVPNPVAGTTMDFSTVNLAADTTLNLGANRTAGLWKFGDTSGSQRWTVAAGNSIILAGTTPTIQVNNNTTQIDSVVSGSAGLTKTGPGNLTLTGANTYAGATTIDTGTLRMAGSSTATAVTVNNTAVLQIGSATGLSSANNLTLNAGTTLDLSGNSVTIGTLVTNATSTITNNSTSATASTATAPGTPALTDALTVSPLITSSILAQIADGATRNTQIVVTNSNANIQNTGNTINTYSGGLVLANPVSGSGTRLSVGTLTGTPFGSGPIIIGQAATDLAGIYFSAATTLPNEIVFNTALGTDRVGIRCDAAVTLSGKITANLAPATFTSNSASSGSATLTGQITGASGLVLDITSKSAAATNFNVTLNNAGTPNNYLGSTVINFNAAANKSATMHLGAANQIPNGSGTGNVSVNSNGTGVGTLNLAGFSETINGLSGNGLVDGTSGTPTLTLGDNNTTSSFSGVIKNTAGILSLVKIGSGTQTLTGTSTYTGSTVINAGTLALGANNVLPATAVSIGNATLDAATFTDTLSTLDVTGSAVINLGSGATLAFADSSTALWTGGTLSITGTFISGVSLRFGTDATGLTSTQLGLITAPGFTAFSLNATGYLTAAVAGSFASWQTANTTTGTFGDDHDNDGVANGIEHFLGGNANTSGLTVLPGVTPGSTLSVTWTKSANYTGTYPTGFVVETSESLIGAWTAETVGATVIITGNEVKYTFPAGPKKFARLKVIAP